MFNFSNNMKRVFFIGIIFIFFAADISYAGALRVPMNTTGRPKTVLEITDVNEAESNEIVEAAIPGTSWLVKLNRVRGKGFAAVDFIDTKPNSNRSIGTYKMFSPEQPLEEIAQIIGNYFRDNEVVEPKDFVPKLNAIPDLIKPAGIFDGPSLASNGTAELIDIVAPALAELAKQSKILCKGTTSSPKGYRIFLITDEQNYLDIIEALDNIKKAITNSKGTAQYWSIEIPQGATSEQIAGKLSSEIKVQAFPALHLKKGELDDIVNLMAPFLSGLASQGGIIMDEQRVSLKRKGQDPIVIENVIDAVIESISEAQQDNPLWKIEISKGSSGADIGKKLSAGTRTGKQPLASGETVSKEDIRRALAPYVEVYLAPFPMPGTGNMDRYLTPKKRRGALIIVSGKRIRPYESTIPIAKINFWRLIKKLRLSDSSKIGELRGLLERGTQLSESDNVDYGKEVIKYFTANPSLIMSLLNADVTGVVMDVVRPAPIVTGL